MNDTKISRIISTTTVQPASINHDNPSQRIELTPSDLRLLKIHYIQKGLLFHKPSDSTNLLVQRFKATLSQALTVFYPLAGHLAMIQNDDDKTACFHVDCNGAGALFVHAVIDGVTVADILDPVIVPDDIVYSFFLMNGVPSYEAAVSKLPLLAVQVTELVDGYFIACSMNHAVADGTSFWNFFNVWSEISRGGHNDDVVSQKSRFISSGREYLDGIVDLPIQVPLPHNIDHHDQTSLADDRDHHRLSQRMFHFSKEKVAELKAKANAEMGFTNNEISSLQALLAHLWISVTRGRDLKPDEDVRYLVAVGLRSRLEPPLPKGYLGNAVRGVMVKSTAEELLDRGLGWAAAQIREMITSVTSTHVRKYWDNWVKSPTYTDFKKLLPPNLLLTGSSPRFNVYGNDFGWGRPVGVRSGPGNKFDGKLTPFPGAEEGSIDFEVCLSRLWPANLM